MTPLYVKGDLFELDWSALNWSRLSNSRSVLIAIRGRKHIATQRQADLS